jgi:hypothetical protein
VGYTYGVNEYEDLLLRLEAHLTEMYSVSDEAVADFKLDLQVAVQFIRHAIQLPSRDSLLRAFQKSLELFSDEDEDPLKVEVENAIAELA